MAGISGIQREADSPLSTSVPFALASILEGYGVDVVFRFVVFGPPASIAECRARAAVTPSLPALQTPSHLSCSIMNGTRSALLRFPA